MIDVNGILVIYHRPLVADASTIMEHVKAFERHSQFKVWKVNAAYGFPTSLRKLRFRTVIFHYSIFCWPYDLDQGFLDYFEASDRSYKIAFFQDEHHYSRPRFEFLNRFRIDCIYTMIEPQYWNEVYLKHTKVSTLVYQVPGYVSEEVLAAAARLSLADEQRTVDVGYRARQLPYYMGKGAQEKTEIGLRFRDLAKDSGLKLDIEIDEAHRIYGKGWHRFLANCRAVLGVEAGVSLFDVDDIVRPQYERLISQHPGITFDEMWTRLLHKWDGNIPYRTMSPRHFEAAAFGVCQILFEGKYSGMMDPITHYIPLKKDFSNFDEVRRMFGDKLFRIEVTQNAHRDLIASGRYSYKKIIQEFDERLIQNGQHPGIDRPTAQRVSALLRGEEIYRRSRTRLIKRLYSTFPGREKLAVVLRPALNAFRGLKGGETGQG